MSSELSDRPSNMLMYLRDGFQKKILRAGTLRPKLHIKLAVSPSQSKLTPGQPLSVDPGLLGTWQGSHRSATFYAAAITPPATSPKAKAKIEPRSGALEAQASGLRQRGGADREPCSSHDALEGASGWMKEEKKKER